MGDYVTKNIYQVHRALLSASTTIPFDADLAYAVGQLKDDEMRIPVNIMRDITHHIKSKTKERLHDMQQFSKERAGMSSSCSLLSRYNNHIATCFYHTLTAPANDPTRSRYIAKGDPAYLFGECLQLALHYDEGELDVNTRVSQYRQKLIKYFSLSAAKVNVLYQFAALASAPIRILYEAMDSVEICRADNRCLAERIMANHDLRCIFFGDKAVPVSDHEIEKEPNLINFPNDPPHSKITGKEYAFQYQKEDDELKNIPLPLAEATEAVAQPAVAPSLFNLVTLKRIQDTLAVGHGGLIKHTSNVYARNYIQKSKEGGQHGVLTGNTVRSYPVKNKDSMTSKVKIGGLYKPAVVALTNPTELITPLVPRSILQSFISRLNDLKIIEALHDPPYLANSLKNTRYISIASFKTCPCRSKCVPVNKIVQFAYATIDLTNPDFATQTCAGNNSNNKRLFTQANSLHTCPISGGDGLALICLDHTRIYPDGEGGLSYLHCEHIKLIPNTTVPQSVSYSDLLNPQNPLAPSFYGIVLCQGSRSCYNQVALAPYEIKEYCCGKRDRPVLTCNNCQGKGVLQSPPPTCAELFERRFFTLTSDREPKTTLVQHKEFKERVTCLAPIMSTCLCQGCICYYCCNHKHHDTDIIYKYIRNFAIPLLEPATEPVPHDNKTWDSNFLLPPVV